MADLDNFVAQLVTMFFLMCYAFVNLACAVQTLLRYVHVMETRAMVHDCEVV